MGDDTSRGRTLVLYAYYEPEPSSSSSPQGNTPASLAAENLAFFVRHGVLGPAAPTHHQATFVFTLMGGFTSVELPTHLPHVHAHSTKNEGFEFCGQAEALR